MIGLMSTFQTSWKENIPWVEASGRLTNFQSTKYCKLFRQWNISAKLASEGLVITKRRLKCKNADGQHRC